jgi:hypothetical protein
MRSVRERTLFVVIGLAVGLVGCSKSADPRANSQSPAASQQANTAPLSPVAQPSQPQAMTSSTESGKGKIDACALLTSSEIQSIQGEPLKETKSSGRSAGGLGVSQCYFALPTSTNSISLVVTQRGDGPGARDPKEFWKETFPQDKDSEQARDKDRDKGRGKEEEESAPPLKIPRIGDEAFWTGNAVGGALYVLKGNAFVRVSIGGSGDQRTKINRSKALARRVLKHL